MMNNDLENAATYLLLFAGLLLCASLLWMALALVKLGMELMGIANPLESIYETETKTEAGLESDPVHPQQHQRAQ